MGTHKKLSFSFKIEVSFLPDAAEKKKKNKNGKVTLKGM